MSAFRVPKGVPADIRRALRLGKPGRFIKTVKALQLADLLQVREREITRSYAKAWAASERARTPVTRQKKLSVLKQLQGEHGKIQHGLEILARGAGVQPLPPLASRDVVPVVRTATPAPQIYAGKVERLSVAGELVGATEWEIGVDYSEEATGHRHTGGRTSDVSFNARIFDPRGKPISETQVRDAMDYYASQGELSYATPRGRHTLAVKAVSWSNWKGDVRQGKPKDLAAFQNILQVVGDGGLRVGAVKPDRL